jgi:serine/threonine-protein kinase
MSFEIGTLLSGRYRLVRRIASGGMGTIFEATQEGLGRKVAIKVVRPELVSKAGLTRLAREARAAATLTHPHIATVYDFIDTPGEAPFLVLELLEGETLRALLRREGALEATRAVRLTTQILSALAAAHDAGIIHRDIKPANVFVTRSPTLGEVAKILDFGVAKVLESEAALTTERRHRHDRLYVSRAVRGGGRRRALGYLLGGPRPV